MNRIDELVEAARMRGVRPWLAIKERLAECAIEVMAAERRTVLQSGAALHFAYHSPRLSADVDFVGRAAHAALSERGEELAARASAIVGAPARWSMRVEGRLARGKVTIELDAARRIVLPIDETDQWAGPEQRPRWLHSSELVEDALLERGEPASDGHGMRGRDQGGGEIVTLLAQALERNTRCACAGSETFAKHSSGYR